MDACTVSFIVVGEIRDGVKSHDGGVLFLSHKSCVQEITPKNQTTFGVNCGDITPPHPQMFFFSLSTYYNSP